MFSPRALFLLFYTFPVSRLVFYFELAPADGGRYHGAVRLL